MMRTGVLIIDFIVTIATTYKMNLFFQGQDGYKTADVALESTANTT